MTLPPRMTITRSDIPKISGISDEMRAELEQAVLACQPFEQVYHNVAGCTISTHCGPNCMGLMFLRK